jgi:hypothetical protein
LAGLVSILKSLFRNELEGKGAMLKNRAVPGLIIAVVFCGLLGGLAWYQGHTLKDPTTNFIETNASFFKFTVWPAEVHANVGEQIEIRYAWMGCHPCPLCPVPIASVDVVLFDSNDSVIRERAMASPYDATIETWSRPTKYRIVGDEAYYKLRVKFCFCHSNCSERFIDTVYTALSFPIIVNQKRA